MIQTERNVIRMDQVRAVGETVDAARREAQISIRSLANDSGIPYPTLNRKLAGKGHTTFDIIQLHLISKVLGRSLSSLLPESMR